MGRWQKATRKAHRRVQDSCSTSYNRAAAAGSLQSKSVTNLGHIIHYQIASTRPSVGVWEVLLPWKDKICNKKPHGHLRTLGSFRVLIASLVYEKQSEKRTGYALDLTMTTLQCMITR